VGEYLAGWIEGKVADGLRPTTERSYRQHIRDHLVPQLGHVRLGDLRPGHIQAMLRTVSAGPSTVRRIHATLRSALSDTVMGQLIAYNPAGKVPLPKTSRPKVTPWEPAELGRFLDYAAGDRLGVLYEVMAASGLRRGEACGLRWADVDLERGRLVVRQQVAVIGHELQFGPPKTASGDARVVDLDDGTVGALLGHRLAQDTERGEWGQAYADKGLVFARENGEPLHPEAVTKRFAKLAASAGLRPVRLHDLRHGQASLMLAAGVQMAVVSKRLGHSSVSITSDTYSHLLEGVGREAAERAAALVPRNRREQFVSTRAAGDESAGSRFQEPAGERGAPPGTRTPNPRIKSPLLCQLS
jgi:integrase